MNDLSEVMRSGAALDASMLPPAHSPASLASPLCRGPSRDTSSPRGTNINTKVSIH